MIDESRTVTQTHEKKVAVRLEQPYLFLNFQCDRPLQKGARFSLAAVDRVNVGRGPSLQAERLQESGASVLKISVPDARMSGMHARLHKVLGRWMIEDAGSKNGTFVDGQRITTVPLLDDALLELGHSFFLFRESLPRADPAFLDGRELRPLARGMATLSPAFNVSLQKVATFARGRLPVLVRGESGTGKELIASAIHELSGRTGPFVPVNCGALPANLVESELFGYRKGAFSGAVEDRPGLVRSSEHGTLLLDEIGDLPLPAQATLLRVLQESEVLPVGGTRPVKVDLRVVAATHRDLAALADEEKFRSDLLARLDGATIVLPPLRERREDFALITSALVEKIAGELARDVAFSVEAARALLMHEWPLNVRELEKCLGSALLLSRGGRVETEHVEESIRCSQRPAPSARKQSGEQPLNERDRRLRDELLQLLKENGGNVTAVARAMGKARTQVQRWLRRFEIDPASFIS